MIFAISSSSSFSIIEPVGLFGNGKIKILVLFIIAPFCLSMFYPNNIVLIISILLLGFGLITEVSTLYKIDEYNKELKNQE